MLRNGFRKFIGGLIAFVFLIAVVQFIRQTVGNEFVGGAVVFGMKVLVFLALVVWVVYLLDRRMKKGQS